MTVLLAALNCYSVKIATNIQIIFTIAKLIAIVIIIIGGIVMLAEGKLTLILSWAIYLNHLSTLEMH